MRRALIATCLGLLIPIATSAQSFEPSTASHETGHPISDSIAASVANPVPLNAFPYTGSSQRWSPKGAIIGTAVGIGLATFVASTLCDSPNCSFGNTLKGIAFAGGLGAALGGIAGGANRVQPRHWTSRSRVGVSTVVTPQTQAGALSVRF